ncbi:MAG TPA: aspartate dehydrogenase [Hyphomicrobiaceae bacterium]|nr:aspartate dehydrogenase [Hyphomicrobiaceae bacterium]
MTQNTLTLAIAGLGAIGLAVARKVDQGTVPGLKLVAVAARDRAKAERNLASFRAFPENVTLPELAERAEVILECIPARHFAEVAEAAVARGRIFMPLSVGQLLGNMHLVDKAKTTGARIIVPTGALLGLDAVRAVAEGNVESVTISTRKPPKGLIGAPHLIENAISVEGLTAAKKVFEGNAREAIKGFPANVNVAVALSLAGIGPERTRVEVWADPAVTRNTHTIRVKSDSSDLTMTIENIPSAENPATGKVTALSAIAALRRLTAPLVVGT